MITKQAANQAYEAGVQLALQDAGLLKSAGVNAGVIQALLAGTGGAGIGALMTPEDRAKGAILGATTGAGLGLGLGLGAGERPLVNALGGMTGMGLGALGGIGITEQL